MRYKVSWNGLSLCMLLQNFKKLSPWKQLTAHIALKNTERTETCKTLNAIINL